MRDVSGRRSSRDRKNVYRYRISLAGTVRAWLRNSGDLLDRDRAGQGRPTILLIDRDGNGFDIDQTPPFFLLTDSLNRPGDNRLPVRKEAAVCGL
jgi:hypothetical protein